MITKNQLIEVSAKKSAYNVCNVIYSCFATVEKIIFSDGSSISINPESNLVLTPFHGFNSSADRDTAQYFLPLR